MLSNGLYSQSFHSDEASQLMDCLQEEARKWPDVSTTSTEEAARRYLTAMLAPVSPEAGLSAEPAALPAPEFKPFSVEKSPLTDTHFVKFRQYHRNIPIYGSLVTVELGSQNELMAMNSALGSPFNVDPIARISPAQAVDMVEREAGSGACRTSAAPEVNYYYDSEVDRWRLTYIFERVVHQKQEPNPDPLAVPQIFDYVVDAHDGKIIAKLPRVQNTTATVTNIEEYRTQAQGAMVETALDDLDQERELVCVQQEGRKFLKDPEFNIHTCDFNFRDINSGGLPGPYVMLPPTPWLASAVSAHANARIVAAFYRDVLQRNGIDGRGGMFISTVQCTDRGGREWPQAMWVEAPGIRPQMLYGQARYKQGKLRSFAASIDVVAHEVTHGVTSNTAGLVYQFEPGAMNESYSDIFGILISNYNEPDIGKWNWQLGEDIMPTGNPLRDVSDPTRHKQPDHMRNFIRTYEDSGGVHWNSGIHNKAFYNLITSKDDQGRFLFDAASVAVLFYLTLSQRLSNRSTFRDSYAGMLLSAQTLFRNDPARDAKLAAIRDAFEAVGIRRTAAAAPPVAMLRLAA